MPRRPAPAHFDMNVSPNGLALWISIADLEGLARLSYRQIRAVLHRACASLIDREKTGSCLPYVCADRDRVVIEMCDGEHMSTLAYEATIALEENGFIVCSHL